MLTPQVRKGFEGSNPSLPAAQARADISEMGSEDIAWAAGLFEGEGTISGYRRKDRPSRAVQMTVYQGAQDGSPALLERFRSITGAGSVVGPYRGRLFHWTTKRIASVEAVSALLWPDLSPERRAQFVRAFSGSERWEQFARRLADVQIVRSERAHELAWAAGLFDGEGSVLVPTRGAPRLELPQATTGGHPHSALVRFHAAVSGIGRITGPRVPSSEWSRLPQHRWEATGFASVQAVIALLWRDLGPTKRQATERALTTYAQRRRTRGAT